MRAWACERVSARALGRAGRAAGAWARACALAVRLLEDRVSGRGRHSDGVRVRVPRGRRHETLWTDSRRAWRGPAAAVRKLRHLRSTRATAACSARGSGGSMLLRCADLLMEVSN
eukprot:6197377-Pleurochrysis_carterae.AAC.1